MKKLNFFRGNLYLIAVCMTKLVVNKVPNKNLNSSNM